MNEEQVPKIVFTILAVVKYHDEATSKKVNARC
jgi:hypothetical protein